MVLNRNAGIGISGPLDVEIAGLERIGVASLDHPLAGRSHPSGAARTPIQLVLTDRSPLTQGHEFAVVGNHTRRLADLGAKRMLLKEALVGVTCRNQRYVMISRRVV